MLHQHQHEHCKFSGLYTCTYFGQGVTLDIRSSTPKVNPRTKSTEPNPFHNDVKP